MNIWVNGCFVILHSGHIDLLWFAKLYDVDSDAIVSPLKQNKLIVGLDSDERVKQLKGDKRPINNIETRGKIMSNLKMVDEVVIFYDDEELRYYIKGLNIDYIVVGDHYRDKEVIGSENAKRGVAFYPTDKRSTTNIIEKIKNL
jgi:D-beta-D-heptose 7-phosphate kinase/D-beta-D-heptose 1-phosphate adenosyltransferase